MQASGPLKKQGLQASDHMHVLATRSYIINSHAQGHALIHMLFAQQAEHM